MSVDESDAIIVGKSRISSVQTDKIVLHLIIPSRTVVANTGSAGIAADDVFVSALWQPDIIPNRALEHYPVIIRPCHPLADIQTDNVAAYRVSHNHCAAQRNAKAGIAGNNIAVPVAAVAADIIAARDTAHNNTAAVVGQGGYTVTGQPDKIILNIRSSNITKVNTITAVAGNDIGMSGNADLMICSV